MHIQCSANIMFISLKNYGKFGLPARRTDFTAGVFSLSSGDTDKGVYEMLLMIHYVEVNICQTWQWTLAQDEIILSIAGLHIKTAVRHISTGKSFSTTCYDGYLGSPKKFFFKVFRTLRPSPTLPLSSLVFILFSELFFFQVPKKFFSQLSGLYLPS